MSPNPTNGYAQFTQEWVRRFRHFLGSFSYTAVGNEQVWQDRSVEIKKLGCDNVDLTVFASLDADVPDLSSAWLGVIAFLQSELAETGVTYVKLTIVLNYPRTHTAFCMVVRTTPVAEVLVGPQYEYA